MKNKRKVNLKLSMLLLLLTAILLIASSYAWFTSNQTVTVSTLNVNVEAKNGLQISTDGTNWKSIIQNADLMTLYSTYVNHLNQIPAVLEPVSTAGNVDTTDGTLEMFYGTVGTIETGVNQGEYNLTATREIEVRDGGTNETGTTGRFIAFDLFFKVNEDTPVYLSTNSIIETSDATSNGIENATRVAFLVEGNVPNGSAIATIQALDGATNGTTYIWEPNRDVHTAPAVANAYDTYGITTTQTGAAALAYEGIEAEIPTNLAEGSEVLLRQPSAGAYTDYLATVVPTHRTVKDFATNLSLFTLTAGITKVRVYMWVEGQDVDCENNASGAGIDFNLQVTTLS